jgi:hypothetical protein
MYNIHSHYENIFRALAPIVTHRRLLYLLPYGATQPENIETISDLLPEMPPYPDYVESLADKLIKTRKSFNEPTVPIKELSGHRTAVYELPDAFPQMNYIKNKPFVDGPLFIFYDQEPVLGEFNHTLFDHIKDNMKGPYVLVTTEKNSVAVDEIQKRYSWPVVYYFHHAFAAHDWYRGYRFNSSLIPPADRTLAKKYISFNRLTSNARVYRSILISELVKRNILDQGYVSYNDVCPDGGTYQYNLDLAVSNQLITSELAEEVKTNIGATKLPLRIDYQDQQFIPNHSFVLSAVEQTQESFCYLVTETCYWESKCHLTEKIFKPIVSKMPFVLVGPAHNLKYLREYGFRTFDRWIDESYDDIEDPIERMTAVGETMSKICSHSLEELKTMLVEMQEVLEHNYNRFYSNEFLDDCWKELITNINTALFKTQV